MALINPAYVVIVPFLFVCTIPLAIFAGVTTTVAFTVLVFRVVLVYTDLALALVPSYLTFRTRSRRYPPGTVSLSKTPTTAGSPTSKTASRSPSPVFNSTSRTLSLTRLRRARSRRPSSAGSFAGFAGSATPLASEGGTGLVPSVGLDRDFEGVGGWRVGDGADDDRWTTINSRLELPDRQYTGRHHHRSPSGGDGGILMMKPRTRTRSGSPETVVFAAGRLATSPNSSRVRTPGNAPPALTAMESRDGEYFPVTLAKSTRKVAA